MSIYDKASLVLIPSGTKTSKVFSQKPVNGDGDFTFSRSTAATRVNADGNIEKETQNFLLQSNSFDTTWGGTGFYSLTSGQSGYDGSNDAWEFDKVAAGNNYITQGSLTNVGVVTASVYAKAGTASGVMIYTENGYGRWNLSTGTLINSGGLPIDSNIEDVGNGWYRCSVTGTSATNYYLKVVDTSGHDTTGSIYIQDAQLEQGLVARDYIETTTAAVEGGITDNVPRLDYTDSSCPALLLEPQRTNGIAYSEYFDSYWDADGQYDNITITHNATASPEGLQNATKLVGNSTSNNPSTAYIGKAGAVSSQPYVSSVFAKAGEYDYIVLTIGSYTSGFWASFNLDTGEVDTDPTAANTTASIEDYGDGWYRCMIHTTNTGGAEGVYFSPSVDGTRTTNYTNTTNGVYIFGAQVEAGSYATSYIPTYGTSVTRNRDNTSLTNVSSLIGQTEGTIYSEVRFGEAGSSSNWLSISAGNAQNWVFVGKDNDDIRGYVRASNSVIFTNQSFQIVENAIAKVAIAYKSGEVVLYINGTQISSSSTAFTFDDTLDSIYFNSHDNGATYETRKQNQVMLFKTRLSNEELADLTTL